MAYIKFNDSENFLEAIVKPVDSNVIRITTDADPVLTGFRLYLRENENYPLDNGEYEAYTTLYRQGEGWYELSNDGSVYEAPVPVEPVELTAEQLAEQEKEISILNLQNQIAVLKDQLESTDYRVIKIFEYSQVDAVTEYDIMALHRERQAIRDQINELEQQLAELQEV